MVSVSSIGISVRFPTARLSESPLWALQQQAYAHLGVESWTRSTDHLVPFHITSNARFAQQYAKVLCAAARDEPLCILELGGGSGRFAYLLLSFLAQRGIKNFTYLLTDCSEKTVQFWEKHPFFEPWLKTGQLQCKVYDPMLSVLPCTKPNIVIANYFFDSLPVDVFLLEGRCVFEGRLHLEADGNDGQVLTDFSKLHMHFSFHLLEKSPYPTCREAHAIVEEYRHTFDKLLCFFPIGALWVLENLQTFCAPHFLLLAADKGPSQKQHFTQETPLRASVHSTCSFPVNFHALARYVALREGKTVFSKKVSPFFTVALFSFGGILPTSCKKALAQQHFGPLPTEAARWSEILQCLEKAHWDATLFLWFLPSMLKMALSLSLKQKEKLRTQLDQIFFSFFPLCHEEAVLFEQASALLLLLEEKQTAFSWKKRARQALRLPAARLHETIAAVLSEKRPQGDVLLIGGDQKICAAIQSYAPARFAWIAWDQLECVQTQFDHIYFFPPPMHTARSQIKPAIVQQIEQHFQNLKHMVYSDEDIAHFIARIDAQDQRYAALFFEELHKNQQITECQYQNALRALQIEAPSTAFTQDTCFRVLQHCITNLLKTQASLHCYLHNGVSLYENRQICAHLIAHPFLRYEENGFTASFTRQ